MPNELKIVIDADVNKAVNGLDKLEREFKQTNAAAQSFGKNITNGAQQASVALAKIPNTSNSATFALTNLGRVAQDLPFGFLGIANNLNPLLESFQRLKTESGSTKTALKALGSSLFGAGGLGFALSVVSSLLIVFGDKLFGSGKKANAAAKETQGFGKVLDEVTSSMAKDASRVTTLFEGLAGGSLNLDERKSALKELKTINADFFGSLKEEGGLVIGLQAAYDGYLKRLVEIGKAKAIQSQLTKLFDRKLQLELTIDPQFLASVDPNTQKKIQELRNQLQALGGPIDVAKEKFDAFNKTQAERARLANRITELESGGGIKFLPGITEEKKREIERLDLAIQGLGKSLQLFGEFDIKPEKALKETDDIVARMQAFIKEFGDVFIVPDLEISFTNTKEKVKAAAIKLNDDINNGLLQLKLLKDPRQINIPIELGLQVDDKGIANDLQKIRDNLLKNANILGDNTKIIKGIVPGASEDVAKRNKAFFDDFQKQILATAGLVDGVLSPAFTGLFDAIIEGKNPMQAFFDGLKESASQLIKKLIQAAAQAAILKALGFVTTGGASSFGGIFSSLLGGAFGGQANRFPLGGAIGSRAFNNVIQITGGARIAGNDIVLSYNRTNNSNVRNG